jgi:hypothetical protein
MVAAAANANTAFFMSEASRFSRNFNRHPAIFSRHRRLRKACREI